MDRVAWQATVRGVARVGEHLVAKPGYLRGEMHTTLIIQISLSISELFLQLVCGVLFYLRHYVNP